MTRPPVGSTGTLAELQVEAGDVYQHTRSKDVYRAEFCKGKLTNRHVEGGWWGINIDFSKNKYRLISRANPDRTPHIVTHEGRVWGSMTAEEKGAVLLAYWGEGIEASIDGKYWYSASPSIDQTQPPFRDDLFVRARPAPVETRVQCYRGEQGVSRDHGTCIKRPDGSIDWQSWEGDE